jgi:hypothetical protein
MRRFALFAAFQCCGILAFGQSLTVNSSTPQALPLFDFRGHQTVQVTRSAEIWKMDSPYDLNAKENPTSAQGGADQRFHLAPLNKSALWAMLDSPSVQPSSLSNRIWPNAKFGPIPTQWPNAKFEPIPTRWPNLKMQPIAGSGPSK